MTRRKKILAIVDNLWDALVIFSRRKESQLHRWANKPDAGITAHDNAATGKDKADKHKGKGRYQAINLSNRNTIEFRLFRGSLVLQTIRATLQCVDLICEYATDHTLAECAAITWDGFKQTGENLCDFCAYCNKRGL